MILSVDIFAVRAKFGDEKAIKMIRQAGFDAVDYFFGKPEIQGEMLGDNYLNSARDIKSMLNANGIFCNQAHAPFIISRSDTFDTSNPNFNELVRSLEFASVLSAKCLVMHGIGVNSEQEFFDINRKFFKSLEPFCEKYNMPIAIENLLWYGKNLTGCLRTPDEINHMLAALDSQWFTFCCDIGHSALCGVEPQDFILNMDNSVLTALHIHDNDRLQDIHSLPYTGFLDWDKITTALSEISYRGDFTYELAGVLQRADASLIPDLLGIAAKTGRLLISKIMSCTGNSQSG